MLAAGVASCSSFALCRLFARAARTEAQLDHVAYLFFTDEEGQPTWLAEHGLVLSAASPPTKTSDGFYLVQFFFVYRDGSRGGRLPELRLERFHAKGWDEDNEPAVWQVRAWIQPDHVE